MKENTIITIGAVALLLLFAIGVNYVKRNWHAATAPVHVTEVEPGVHCAIATGEDGIGIDCWKVQP